MMVRENKQLQTNYQTRASPMGTFIQHAYLLK
jgi:hypothetical protein